MSLRKVLALSAQNLTDSAVCWCPSPELGGEFPIRVVEDGLMGCESA